MSGPSRSGGVFDNTTTRTIATPAATSPIANLIAMPIGELTSAYDLIARWISAIQSGRARGSDGHPARGSVRFRRIPLKNSRAFWRER